MKLVYLRRNDKVYYLVINSFYKKPNIVFICNSQRSTVCKTDCKLAGPHELLLHKNYIWFFIRKLDITKSK